MLASLICEISAGLRMRVFIGGEFSGIVRNAFLEEGHEAISCDLLPTEKPPHEFHHVGDMFEYLDRFPPFYFDLGIFHPDCSKLCLSGVRWLYIDGRKENGRDEQRWREMEEARSFFLRCVAAKKIIRRVAVENSQPHGYSKLPPHTQIIQPHMFGDPESKATYLWLEKLPPLRKTNDVSHLHIKTSTHYASPGPDRWKDRSRTFSGIAKAMAQQWGELK